jgi:2-polyprenyl-3-methyl-5-hydroxy-6-metoxy-1,4-benzoquinol methylase
MAQARPHREDSSSVPYEQEVREGDRFSFGENWRTFLSSINDQRIKEAETSLKRMLEIDDLAGKSFLDVGSGSGLFSLVARRLGARVLSFDYDMSSVWCTNELRRRYFADDPDWKIEHGSALDLDYLKSLGQFDVVYSWGVLHHTGAMWQAIDAVTTLVRPNGGKFFIAIYNDQGMKSKAWGRVKKLYCSLPSMFRPLLLIPSAIFLWGPEAIRDCVKLRPFQTMINYHRRRGMSLWSDLVDWVGGYPFEVARPEAIFEFFRKRRFSLRKLRTVGGGLGCNEFVFVRKN